MSPVLLACPVVILSGAALLADVFSGVMAGAVVVVYLTSLWTGRWGVFLGAALFSVLAIPLLTFGVLNLWGVVLALPALPAVSFGLQSIAMPLMPSSATSKPRPSLIAVSMVTVLACGLFIAIVVQAIILAASCAMVAIVLLGTWYVQFRRLGRQPLVAEVLESRVGAGTTVRREVVIRRVCRSCCNVSIRVSGGAVVESLSPVRINGDSVEVVVSLTPLLGGPTDIMVYACVSDELGLIYVGQSLRILHLHVIPRAQVAQSAAMRFLEKGEMGEGGGNYLAGDIAEVAGLSGGGEYVASRAYVPGDSIRTVDWKHTAKLQSLVVKTFGENPGATGLILVNLGVANADEADRLVYKFLSGVLAVVGLSQSAAIGLYGDGQEERIGQALEGRALVRRALNATAEVQTGIEWSRMLQPMSLQAIEARINSLRRMGSETALRLLGLLGLEARVMREGVRVDPVGRLIHNAVNRFYPSWCVAFTAMQWDAGSLLTELRSLEMKGIRTLIVDVGKSDIVRANRA
ncbi:MAG: DUF58 domain-containing protein [Dehalococcoidia bacterium]|nr:DUF58 domain-containing protein [Dehalococcoidia bacterium]